MTMEFLQYIRSGETDRTPVGVFSVILNGNTVNIGWSLCAICKGDHFNKQMGIKIANGRRNSERNPYTFNINDPESANQTLNQILSCLPEKNKIERDRVSTTFNLIVNRCRRITANYNNKIAQNA